MSPSEISSEAINAADDGRHCFDFESYGVFVRIESAEREIVDGAADTARVSLLGNLRASAPKHFDHIFRIDKHPDGNLALIQNGTELGSSENAAKLYKFFDSILRVSVGESSPNLVFIHAGAVGWKGKAIILPADSFQGKSTLVAELVRIGAEYYSDDFTILDEQGNVHPFPRRLSMRTPDYMTYEIGVEELGGTIGNRPIPPGAVVFTAYDPMAKWTPTIETVGTGLLKLIPFTLSIRNQPEFSMQVLQKMTTRAIIISSLRGSAERFAKTLLDFVDNHGI